MRKVVFVSPSPIDRKKINSTDPRDFIPIEREGWALEDALYSDLAAVKDARGYWDVYDVRSGRFLNSVKYRTRKDAFDTFDKWSVKLAEFARDNRDGYRKLCDLAEAVTHELRVIQHAEWKGSK